jgi:uncharacterized membrane protein
MRIPSSQPESKVISAARVAARLLLGGALLFAGTTHLTSARQEFRAQVPRSLPLSDDTVVVMSGLAELTLGGALIVLPRYQMLVGWIAAAFFVAVFPGNIAQYLNRVAAFGLDSDRSRAIRLLFQPVLVAWALWSTRAWSLARDHAPRGKD